MAAPGNRTSRLDSRLRSMPPLLYIERLYAYSRASALLAAWRMRCPGRARQWRQVPSTQQRQAA